jgi:hypothetical protein
MNVSALAGEAEPVPLAHARDGAGARRRSGGAAARAPRCTASPIVLPCHED